MNRTTIRGLTVLALVTALGAHDRSLAGKGEYDPEIRPGDFSTTIDNPYLPLTPGRTFHYRSQTKEGVETNDVTTTSDTKMTAIGVEARVVHDLVYLDGQKTEETFDWYAQDKDGNVWYFGEDSRTFSGGVQTGTEGSWEAGVAGAKPGIIMEANPQKGDSYQQEFAPGVAEDMAKVSSTDEFVTVPFKSFDHCLETTEWTPIEPGAREHKFYAKNVGLVLELSPKGGGVRSELIGIDP